MTEIPPVKYARAPDGGHVAYMDFGASAPPHLTLREWAAPLEGSWEHPVHLRHWHTRAATARTIILDPRGVGSSDPLPFDRLGSVEAGVEDAVAVLDAAEIDSAIVSAEGFSAHVAITLAVTHPGRVKRLLLANPYADARALRYGAEAEAESMEEWLRANWGTGRPIFATAPALARDDSYLDFCARLERRACGPNVAAAMFRASRHSDVSALLPRVDVPALVVHTPDLAHIPVEASRAVSEALPDVQFLRISESNFYWFDDPEVSHAVAEFMGGAIDVTLERRLATILFTDIVGSTDHASAMGDERWTATLGQVDTFVARTVERHGGRMVKQTGDGHLVEFATPTPALHGAVALVHGVPALGVEIRVGVHVGEVEVRPGGDLAGIGVHTAARIMGAAEPGKVMVSAALQALAAGSGFRFTDRGAHTLKGVPGEWPLFEASP